MANSDPYYTFDTAQVEVIRLRRGQHWFAYNSQKHYVTSCGNRQLYLEDYQVFRCERDAAIALAKELVSQAKAHLHRASIKNAALGSVIAQYDIADCPYLVSNTDM